MGVQCKQEGAEHTALRGSSVVMVVQGTYPETYWFICRLIFKNGPGKLNISKEKASCWELLVLAYSAQTGGDDFFSWELFLAARWHTFGALVSIFGSRMVYVEFYKNNNYRE